MRVLICGDRDWKDVEFIRYWIERLKENHEEVHHALQDYPGGFDPLVILEGEARGADRIAREQAELLGIQVDRYPAFWNKYGKSAGPIRNQQMIEEGMPDVIMAFHDDIENSKGTKDMLKRAKRAGLRYRLFTHANPADAVKETNDATNDA